MIRFEQLASINFRPQSPRHYRPCIGLIGCGGITVEHLRAYRAANFQVTCLCDIDRHRAEQRQREFFPDAKVVTDFGDLLRDDSIEVVDIATHPPNRPQIIRQALAARKHVLSQKPFVLDLDEGLALVDLADKVDRYLAVNQNGRWAPHFCFARQVAEQGLIGDISAVHLSCHWDHTWVKGTEFEKVKYLVLYDYAIHWFDMVRCLLPGKNPTRVFASTARAPGQSIMPNLLAQALIEFDEAQATLAFDAALPVGAYDRTWLSGSEGSLLSSGPSIQLQSVTVNLAEGSWSPALTGSWFPDAFHGTMGELLCAIEDKRPCTLNARDNLDSLALCFAAIASVENRSPMKPGAIRKLPN